MAWAKAEGKERVCRAAGARAGAGVMRFAGVRAEAMPNGGAVHARCGMGRSAAGHEARCRRRRDGPKECKGYIKPPLVPQSTGEKMDVEQCPGM